MPNVLPRTVKKASWSMDHLEKAVKLIEEQIRKAAKTMNIPFSSLQKRYTKKATTKEPRLGLNIVFTPEMEK